MKKLHNLFTFILDLLCPPTCPICHQEVETIHTLCCSCYKQLNFITKPCCQICGRPFEYVSSENLICGSCLKQKPPFRLARSILEYDNFSKQLILSYKHGDRTNHIPLFLKFLNLVPSDLYKNVDFIIPVPIHWTRRLKRRYNQAGLLGYALSKKVHIPLRTNILRRIKATASQGHLTPKERQRNIKNAFYVKNPKAVQNKTILIIDDVFTTGLTVNTCAKILRRAGAKEIRILTVYRVLK
jgi:ComF family protein